MNPLIDNTVTKVWLASDGQAIKFDVENGDPIIATADGDCCSHTWIEGLDMPIYLLGKVVSVEDLMLGGDDSGELKFYGCKITTDKGVCVIDYRNSSNGYYGGDLVWPGEYHYGGVFDQNVSNNDWKEVV